MILESFQHKVNKELRHTLYICASQQITTVVRRAVKKFSEMWYSTEMVGHMTTLT